MRGSASQALDKSVSEITKAHWEQSCLHGDVGIRKHLCMWEDHLNCSSWEAGCQFGVVEGVSTEKVSLRGNRKQACLHRGKEEN